MNNHSSFAPCKCERPYEDRGRPQTMQTYSPAQYSHPHSIAVSHFIRQNPWTRLADPIAFVKATRKLIAPYAHTREQMLAYNADPMLYKKLCRVATRTFLAIPTGAYVIVPAGGEGLLVRVISETKPSHSPEHYVAHRRTCHVEFTEGCDICDNSVEEIIDASGVIPALNRGATVEPFWTLERDVEILGALDIAGRDWRHFASPASIGAIASYWAPTNKM